MAESRIVNKPSAGWTHILNTVAQDKRLGLDTRGLFVLMKSFPADWEFCISGLATMAGCGKDKIRRMLGELESAGYLLREQTHDSSGKFSGNTYVLQDHPPTVVGKTDDGDNRCRVSPSRAKPSTAEPSTENPTQTNKYTKQINTPLPPTGGMARKRKPKAVPEWQADRFERFWAAYPRDEDRAKAVEQWDKLPADKELMARHGGDPTRLLDEIARGLQRHLASEDWRNNVGVPYAFRWLRDRRWTEKSKGCTPEAYRPTPPTCRTAIEDGEEVVIFGH